MASPRGFPPSPNRSWSSCCGGTQASDTARYLTKAIRGAVPGKDWRTLSIKLTLADLGAVAVHDRDSNWYRRAGLVRESSVRCTLSDLAGQVMSSFRRFVREAW